jgi:dipeptidase E
MPAPKLFLYSLQLTGQHYKLLNELVDKKATNIHFACIENATDIIPGAEGWVPGIRQQLIEQGYQVETVDLRKFITNKKALAKKLSEKDVIWLCGGHTYYLRWILSASGADEIIKESVANGTVYAGWSAGAIMAGPTTNHFDLMGDDPIEAPEHIAEGLNLTDTVIVPHLDNADFAAGAKQANEALIRDGFKTLPINDDQVYIINGSTSTLK